MKISTENREYSISGPQIVFSNQSVQAKRFRVYHCFISFSVRYDNLRSKLFKEILFIVKLLIRVICGTEPVSIGKEGCKSQLLKEV